MMTLDRTRAPRLRAAFTPARTLCLALGLTLMTAGCAQTRWQTDYQNQMNPEVTRGWTVTQVNVVVPPNLTVSDANTLAPDADIVWHGDAPGDRRAQVAAVMRQGVMAGARDLHGPRKVTLSVVVREFHAVTPITERTFQHSGVNDIRYVIQPFDARTGEALAPAEEIEADMPALVGDEERRAAAQGSTQKSRIVSHIAAVTAGWLGTGPDARRHFVRLGR